MNYRSVRLWGLAALCLFVGCDTRKPESEQSKPEEQSEPEGRQSKETTLMKVSFTQPASAYLLGEPIPIYYQYRSEIRASLEMNHRGAPRGLRFEMTDSLGKQLAPPAPMMHIGPPTPLRPNERYIIEPKETIRFGLDIDELFAIDTPGRYVLSAWYFEQKLAAIDINIVAMRKDGALVVTGGCAHPISYPSLAQGAVGVQCDISFGPAFGQDPNESWWFVRAAGTIKYRDGPVPGGPAMTHLSPAGTKVVATALDYRWQLWTVLESEKGRALMIWNVRTGEVRTLVPWGQHDVTIGSTRAQSHKMAKVVFGGVTGEPKFSTEVLTPLE